MNKWSGTVLQALQKNDLCVIYICHLSSNKTDLLYFDTFLWKQQPSQYESLKAQIKAGGLDFDAGQAKVG